jgi:hypothetical protein
MPTTLAQTPVTLSDLEKALLEAWARETSADPDAWSEENRAWGQCAVTALLVQDIFGGVILRGEIGSTSHYWNLLPSGDEVDLTKRQFVTPVDVVNTQPRTRDYLLSHPDTARRYRRLRRLARGYLRRFA